MSFKHGYPLPIESYWSFLRIPTRILLAKANLVIHFPTILSRMPLAEADIVIHLLAIISGMPLAKGNLIIYFPAILSGMLLAKANLVIHFPAILSRMPLAEANLVNTLDFIYIKHGIYCFCIHQKNIKLHKCKKKGKWRTCSACLVASPSRRSNPGHSSWTQGSLWSWSLQADVIENPYSFTTHMLLSMHVHFLIITYIHI